MPPYLSQGALVHCVEFQHPGEEKGYQPVETIAHGAEPWLVRCTGMWQEGTLGQKK